MRLHNQETRTKLKALAALVLLATSFSALPASGQQAAKPSPPLCYAFWLDGDEYTNCEGRRERITRFADVEEFAVDPNGKKMAVIRHQAKVQARTWLAGIDGYYSSHDALQVISLDGLGRERFSPLTWPMGLYASCGTVVDVTGNPERKDPGPFLDLLAGGQLTIEPYLDFTCSSHRRVVVGHTERHSLSTPLRIGVPPEGSVPGSGGNGQILYSLSPSGKYIAYLYGGFYPADDRNQLCVVATGSDRANCINEEFQNGGISVADTGEVLWGTVAQENCYHKESYRLSTKALPGYEPWIECPVIMYWRPGEGKARVVEPLGEYPQWVGSETASALGAWAARSQATK